MFRATMCPSSHSPTQSLTAPHSPLLPSQPHKAHSCPHSPSQPHTAPHSPLLPSQPHTAPHSPLQPTWQRRHNFVGQQSGGVTGASSGALWGCVGLSADRPAGAGEAALCAGIEVRLYTFLTSAPHGRDRHHAPTVLSLGRDPFRRAEPLASASVSSVNSVTVCCTVRIRFPAASSRAARGPCRCRYSLF